MTILERNARQVERSIVKWLWIMNLFMVYVPFIVLLWNNEINKRASWDNTVSQEMRVEEARINANKGAK